MLVLIQHVETTWTKRSRGAPGALKRNAVPESFLVPITEIAAFRAVVALHLVRYWEENSFESPSEMLRLFKDYASLGTEFRATSSVEGFAVAVKQRPPLVQSTLQGQTELDGVHFRTGNNLLEVSCNPAHLGAPYHRPSIRFNLAPGQWGRAVRNARYNLGFDSYWTYGKTVINIGWFDGTTNDVFMRTDPTFSGGQMSQLW